MIAINLYDGRVLTGTKQDYLIQYDADATYRTYLFQIKSVQVTGDELADLVESGVLSVQEAAKNKEFTGDLAVKIVMSYTAPAE